MANLTKTTYYTRRTLAIGGILLTGFIVLKVSLRLATDVWRKLNPPPPPPPTVAFGKLPKIKFPESSPAEEQKLTFQLETIEGNLPILPSVGKVYFRPIDKPGLLTLDRAKAKAQQMGFRTQPQAISETHYRWLSLNVPPTTLEMEIDTGNFHLRYPYETDQELLASKNLPTNEQAAQEAKRFLQANELLAEDLASGRAEFQYWRLSPSGLAAAIALSEADFIQVNLFRSDLDELKILPPNPEESLVSFLISGARDRSKRIIEINYTYFPVEKETSATYPLRPISNAWQELQAGQGYVATLGQNENKQITIRRVYLAYYDSAEPKNYLQPVYVFEGDKNFFAYVSAIDPKWTE